MLPFNWHWQKQQMTVTAATVLAATLIPIAPVALFLIRLTITQTVMVHHTLERGKDVRWVNYLTFAFVKTQLSRNGVRPVILLHREMKKWQDLRKDHKHL